MKLIVGLGNPGPTYQNTRHNAGFLALDMLQKHFQFPTWKQEKSLKCELTKGIMEAESVLLIKPTTFMNLSGEAVVAVSQFYKIPPEDILVIFDDVDLPTGTVRYREKGSAGTHNGMRSILSLLGKDTFPRLKLGIKPEHPIKDLSSFVLGHLTEDELAALRLSEEEMRRRVTEFLRK